MKDTLKGKKTYLSLLVTAAAVLLGINQIESVDVIPIPDLPISEEVGETIADPVAEAAAGESQGSEITIAPEGTQRRGLFYSLAALAGIALAAYSRSLAQPQPGNRRR